MSTKVNVKFNGKVVAYVNKKYAQVATIAEDRTGKKYETLHNVKLPKGIKPEIGSYIAIAGTLESEAGTNWIDTSSKFQLLESEPEDQNMYAWIEGEAAASFFEPKSLTDEFSSKRPFGVASVKVNETRRQRGIVFNNLIATMRANLKAGALVRLAGRIQYRKYTNNENQEVEIPEIICNNEFTKIIKLSDRVNPFSFGTDDNTQIMVGFTKAAE